ncbi:hypothetical protein ScPMuIL_003422 [Solemya velum]
MALMSTRTAFLFLLVVAVVCTTNNPSKCRQNHAMCLQRGGDSKACAYSYLTCLRAYCSNFARSAVKRGKVYAVKLVACYVRHKALLLLLIVAVVCTTNSPSKCRQKHADCLEKGGDSKECIYSYFMCLKSYCYNFAKYAAKQGKSYAVKFLTCLARHKVPERMWD